MDRIVTRTTGTQARSAIDLSFIIFPNGAGTPTLGEGDASGSYIKSLARSSAGVYTFTTADPFVAFMNGDASIQLATPVGQWSAMFTGPPTKNANGTFTFTLNLFLIGAATDIAANAGNMISVWLRFRNSTTLP